MIYTKRLPHTFTLPSPRAASLTRSNEARHAPLGAALKVVPPLFFPMLGLLGHRKRAHGGALIERKSDEDVCGAQTPISSTKKVRRMRSTRRATWLFLSRSLSLLLPPPSRLLLPIVFSGRVATAIQTLNDARNRTKIADAPARSHECQHAIATSRSDEMQPSLPSCRYSHRVPRRLPIFGSRAGVRTLKKADGGGSRRTEQGGRALSARQQWQIPV